MLKVLKAGQLVASPLVPRLKDWPIYAFTSIATVNRYKKNTEKQTVLDNKVDRLTKKQSAL